MVVSEQDRRILRALQAGLPLASRPFAHLAAALELDEQTVIERLAALQAAGVIRRLGLIVRHHELGYRANAMVVWDVPDNEVDEAGERLAASPEVTLCYQRPRRPPQWRYNLFSMIHGRDRETVLGQIARLRRAAALEHVPYEVLFSRRRFKQQGARYGAAVEVA